MVTQVVQPLFAALQLSGVYRPAAALALCVWMAFAVLGADGTGTPVGLPPNVKQISVSGLHNCFRLGSKLFSGSAPEGDEGFAALAQLGVKTILSVDGARPDVATAHRHGLRYVHLPHGYEGIHTNVQLQLIRAAETQAGPIYLHCHHGKHRGPAAAAVICRAENGWTLEQAESWLRLAGTATNYTGLYQAVRDFRHPTWAQLQAVRAEFPEAAQVAGLVENMVAIDERWEDLQAVRAAGYKAPPKHPDLQPAHEALMLWEHFREAQRLPAATRRGRAFVDRLKSAETEAVEADRLLRVIATDPEPAHRAALDATFDRLGKTCRSCHEDFRDRPVILEQPEVKKQKQD